MKCIFFSNDFFCVPFKARKLISNEFAVADFPEEIRKIVFEFLGHSGDINRLHYCAPDVARILKVIASSLQRINDNFVGEELHWADNEEDQEDTAEVPVMALCDVSPPRGAGGWGAEHTALHPSRGKENVGQRRRNRGLVARRGT